MNIGNQAVPALGPADEGSKITIGEFNYTVFKLPTDIGVPIWHKLAVGATKAIGAAVASEGEGQMVSGFINAAMEDLSLDFVQRMIDVFAQKTFVSRDQNLGNPLSKIVNTHFAGRYEDLSQWLVFCVEVNFTGFFTWLISELKTAQSKAEKVLGTNIN